MKKGMLLAEMRLYQDGVVSNVRGGFGLTRRLDAIGIRPGVRITMGHRQRFGGPVTVRVGNAQLALGFGMAKKIEVEVEEEE